MPSITLAEAAPLSQNELEAGLIETVLSTDQFFQVLPFDEMEGNALAYNRESVLGDVQVLGVGGNITARAATKAIQVTSTVTTIIGDAEINGLVEATQSNINDQRAIQVAGKAKAAGLSYCRQLITGSGTGDEFAGLLALMPSGQTIAAGTNGDDYSFDILDVLIDQIRAKGGKVDFIQMPRRTRRAHFKLLRAAGGNTAEDLVTLPSGEQVPAYRSVPLFINDNIPTNQTQGTATNTTTIIAGCFDDGSRKVGIAGLNVRGSAGLRAENVGTHQSRDEKIIRVKWYAGLAVFNEAGLACVKGIKN